MNRLLTKFNNLPIYKKIFLGMLLPTVLILIFFLISVTLEFSNMSHSTESYGAAIASNSRAQVLYTIRQQGLEILEERAKRHAEIISSHYALIEKIISAEKIYLQENYPIGRVNSDIIATIANNPAVEICILTKNSDVVYISPELNLNDIVSLAWLNDVYQYPNQIIYQNHYFALAFTDDNNNPLGIIIIKDLFTIKDLLLTTTADYEEISILDLDGNFLTAKPSIDIMPYLSYGKTSLVEIVAPDDNYYIYQQPMEGLESHLVIIFNDNSLTSNFTNLTNRVALNTNALISQVESSRKNIANTISFIFLLSFLLILWIAYYLSKKITTPLLDLEDAVHKISKGDLDTKIKITSRDDIAKLGRAINTMSKRLKIYIGEMTILASHKKKVELELEFARKIQTSTLPKNFADVSKQGTISLYATCKMAKEVGGDFYDFLWLDDDNFLFVIADVSGKGVPGALFMMRAKAVIRQYAMRYKKPGLIIEQANRDLNLDNDEGMFVTVWLGILNTTTGDVAAVNAGHKLPAVRTNGNWTLLKEKHAAMVGIMEDIPYSKKEYHFKLNPGDMILLTTDGVDEANNKNNELFGNERLLNALTDTNSPSELISTIEDAIGDFVENNEQFDDITMLSILYKGKE